jgi:hypothetical protein
MPTFKAEFESFLDYLASDVVYSDEITPNAIGENRAYAIAPLLEIYENAAISVWLSEKDTNIEQFRLSYIFSHSNLLRGKPLGLSLSNADGKSDFITSNETIDMLKLISIKATYNEGNTHSLIDFVSIRSRFSESHSTGARDKILGYIFICATSRVFIEKQAKIVMNIVSNRLAALIQTSRLRRVISISNEIPNLFATYKEPRDLIIAVGGVVKQRVGAESMLILSETGEVINSDGNDVSFKWQGYSLFSRLFDAACNSAVLRADNEIIGELQASVGESVTIRNALVIRVLLEGIVLRSGSEFVSAGNFEKLARKQDHTLAVIILINKESLDYLGEWFSTTDINVGETMSNIVSNTIDGVILNNNRQIIDTYFEREAEFINLSRKHSVTILKKMLSKLIDIRVIHGMDVDDLCLGADAEVGVSGIGITLTDLFEKSVNYSMTPADAGRSVINVFCHCPEKTKVVLIFHIPTKSDTYNYICFILGRDSLSYVEYASVKAFVQEFHITLIHRDTLRERVSAMAQVRHAVVGPLSACVEYLEAAVKAVNREKRTESAWEAFRSDSIIQDDLPHALSLAQQARVLADSARFLVKKNIDEMVISNQQIDILNIIDEIKLSLQFELDRRRLRWTISTNLSRKQEYIFGRRDLMWIAIYNIIENAVKYAAQGTNIFIELKRIGAIWRFSVTDDGVYIPEDEREEIWNVFYRGYQADNLNRRMGTGLGLYVTKMIILAHSKAATYGCDSARKGEGRSGKTSFYFELPCRVPK